MARTRIIGALADIETVAEKIKVLLAGARYNQALLLAKSMSDKVHSIDLGPS